MIKVGLTGNRFSGKDIVCGVFNDLTVPIFDADVIIKYIINFDYDFTQILRNELGYDFFDKGHLDTNALINRGLFGKVLSLIEDRLLFAYNEFEKKHSNSIYTIFKCSVLYEMDWYRYMDLNIFVNSPFVTRMERCVDVTNKSITQASLFLYNEKNEDIKKEFADFIIDNDKDFVFVKSKIHEIDSSILDYFANSLQSELSKYDDIESRHMYI